jgi:ATP-dependent Clp protease adaptor protein ClpS
MYKVLLHNDDYTTMEFVLEVLMSIFRRSRVEATRIMLTVHEGGKGIAGVYTREIAETKATTTMDRARAAGFPLLVTTEPE